MIIYPIWKNVWHRFSHISKVLLPLFLDADWFSFYTNFMYLCNCHCTYFDRLIVWQFDSESAVILSFIYVVLLLINVCYSLEKIYIKNVIKKCNKNTCILNGKIRLFAGGVRVDMKSWTLGRIFFIYLKSI